MVGKLILILVYAISINYSFAQRAFTDEQLEGYLPKKEVKYKLAGKPFNLQDSTVVSTTAVYVKVSEEGERINYGTVRPHTWMRFFSDGRVFISFAYLSYPSEEEFNDLNYGKYGRYIISDDGEIIIEFYQDKQCGVMFMFAQNVSTGIQFYATSYRLHSLFKSKSMEGGFYRKDYTQLYN